MSVRDQIRKLLTGISFPQEYLCSSLEEMAQCPLRIFLTVQGKTGNYEVTGNHLFLGYKPLIIALPNHGEWGTDFLFDREKVCLHFGDEKFETNTTWKGYPSDRKSVGRLILRKIERKEVDQSLALYFFVGDFGQHFFINFFHQWINYLREKVRSRKADNIGLPGNLYDQVRIAYSIPRPISLITVSDNNLINIFPTDLHGSVGKKYYIGSLRKNGQANQQVETFRKLVLSEIQTEGFKEAYALGKNHMKELRNVEEFQILKQKSSTFNFALPLLTTKYRELVLMSSLDIGIHRVHLFEVLNECVLNSKDSILVHIHQYYAEWRKNQSLKDRFLIR